MKVFTANQIKDLDRYTIQAEPIHSIDLMERSSKQFVDIFQVEIPNNRPILIFAGPGNNGGDALAIARLLILSGYNTCTYLFNPKNNLSPDCETNKKRLLALENVKLTEVSGSFSLPLIEKEDIIIDGLFGTGLNQPLTGGFASVVHYINQTGAAVYSIDLPSGLFGEDNTQNNLQNIIKARKTFSFQAPKLAFFMAENAEYTGEWNVLDIQLHPGALQDTPTPYYYTQKEDVVGLLKPRPKFAHKGIFGHALLIAGSKGKTGAAILAAKACLRSGVGLLTCHIPGCGNNILPSALPEAMYTTDLQQDHISEIPPAEEFDVIGIGPGVGQHKDTLIAIQSLLQCYKKPMVIDADALNLIAKNNFLLKAVPAGSILTPHPKEFDRLAGYSATSFERLQKARELARQMNCYIVLKGAYTAVVTPDRECFFNSTGNPGMATAGSGDVLTGILTGLLAQGYTSFEATVLGVYLHGLAGDLALQKESLESLIAGDLIDHLGKAFLNLKR